MTRGRRTSRIAERPADPATVNAVLPTLCFAPIAALLVILAVNTLVAASSTTRRSRCNKYVSTTGRDSNNGNTEATAYRHIHYLLENGAKRLRPGQVGCLVSGELFHEEEESVNEHRDLFPRPIGETITPGYPRAEGTSEKELEERVVHGTEQRPITITSTIAAHPATIDGRIALENGANWITFSRLVLRTNAISGENEDPSPTIGSSHTSWIYDDISGGSVGICIAPDGVNDDGGHWGIAEYTLIEHDRIHNCGHPVTRIELEDQWCDTYPLAKGECPSGEDAGERMNGWHAHGVYNEGNHTIIKNSYLYENSGIGILLRGGSGAVVEHNVIDDNGRGIEFGNKDDTGATVAWNIITNTNSECGRETGSDPHCSTYGVSADQTCEAGDTCTPPFHNLVEKNDVWGSEAPLNIESGVQESANGCCQLYDNLEVNPRFKSAGRHDYTLEISSPLHGLGYGPESPPVSW